MPVIQRCHEHVRARCSHVVTTIKIEDQAGATNQLKANVAAVEEKVGRPLRRDRPGPANVRPGPVFLAILGARGFREKSDAELRESLHDPWHGR
jgi:hypothetical protein